jgi:hypothetical protein
MRSTRIRRPEQITGRLARFSLFTHLTVVPAFTFSSGGSNL